MKMLMLARHINERIMINDDIIILVQGVDISRGKYQVKLGIEAPARHIIDREEIYLKRKKEKEMAILML